MAQNQSNNLPGPSGKSGPGNTPGTPEKDPKDKPELAGIPKDPNEDPNERDQDPDHPANITPAYTGDPSPRPVAEGITVPPAELLTEQEKEAAAGGPNAGVGPVTPSAVTTGPVETIEDLGIGPRTPYPTGNPPPSREETTLSQGIWHGDEADAPVAKDARYDEARDMPDQYAEDPTR